MLGGEGERPLALSFLLNIVRGVGSDAGIIGLEGAAHAVKDNARGERALVRRVGEDQSGQEAGVGTEGDRVKDGEDGFAKASRVVIRGRANDGVVALPRCSEEGDGVQGGRHDGDGQLAGGFLISDTNHV